MNIYQTTNGPCPYLPTGEWTTNVFFAENITDKTYENLLECGWRRSGTCFYYNTCSGCQRCIPLRVDVKHFSPNRSQKRTLNRNHAITIERIPTAFHAPDYALYKKYCLSRHDQMPTEEGYNHFLVESPLTTEIIRYRSGENLIALSWIDMLPASISSVYCAYDPDYAQLSPGTLSILLQIELCRTLQKPWLYLGFYVPESTKMNYKKNFLPCQGRINHQWQDM